MRIIKLTAGRGRLLRWTIYNIRKCLMSYSTKYLYTKQTALQDFHVHSSR